MSSHDHACDPSRVCPVHGAVLPFVEGTGYEDETAAARLRQGRREPGLASPEDRKAGERWSRIAALLGPDFKRDEAKHLVEVALVVRHGGRNRGSLMVGVRDDARDAFAAYALGELEAVCRRRRTPHMAWENVKRARLDYLTPEALADHNAREESRRSTEAQRDVDALGLKALRDGIAWLDSDAFDAASQNTQGDALMLLGTRLHAVLPRVLDSPETNAYARAAVAAAASSPRPEGTQFPEAGELPNRRRSVRRTRVSAEANAREATLRALVGDTGEPRLAAGLGLPGSVSPVSIPSADLVREIVTAHSARGDLVLDPFAGGPTRSVVTAHLGRRYHGVDLNAAQVQADAMRLAQLARFDPIYRQAIVVEGDSTEYDWASAVGPAAASLVLSCPPYFNLERYGGGPRDLSEQDSYEGFLARMRDAFVGLLPALAPGAVVALILGQVRDGARVLDIPADVRAVLAALDFEPADYRGVLVRLTPQQVRSRTSTLDHEDILLMRRRGASPASRQARHTPTRHETAPPVPAPTPAPTPAPASAASPAPTPPAASPSAPSDAEPRPTVTVKVSAASARLKFHGCDPDYIRDVCKASCCQSTVDPSGIIVATRSVERDRLRELGATVGDDGLIASVPGSKACPKKCPFKTEAHLCGLHETEDKPFGCIASPFKLNSNGTLEIRNRYKLLTCFKDGDAPIPAYRAFAASLRLLFGDDEAARITAHLDAGGGDLMAEMLADAYEGLRELEPIHKGATS